MLGGSWEGCFGWVVGVRIFVGEGYVNVVGDFFVLFVVGVLVVWICGKENWDFEFLVGISWVDYFGFN